MLHGPSPHDRNKLREIETLSLPYTVPFFKLFHNASANLIYLRQTSFHRLCVKCIVLTKRVEIDTHGRVADRLLARFYAFPVNPNESSAIGNEPPLVELRNRMLSRSSFLRHNLDLS